MSKNGAKPSRTENKIPPFALHLREIKKKKTERSQDGPWELGRLYKGLNTRGWKQQPLLNFQRVGTRTCFNSLSLNLQHLPAPPPAFTPRMRTQPQNAGSTRSQALSNLVLLNRTNTLRSHHVSAHRHHPAVQKRLSPCVRACLCLCAVPVTKVTAQHFTL